MHRKLSCPVFPATLMAVLSAQTDQCGLLFQEQPLLALTSNSCPRAAANGVNGNEMESQFSVKLAPSSERDLDPPGGAEGVASSSGRSQRFTRAFVAKHTAAPYLLRCRRSRKTQQQYVFAHLPHLFLFSLFFPPNPSPPDTHTQTHPLAPPSVVDCHKLSPRPPRSCASTFR